MIDVKRYGDGNKKFPELAEEEIKNSETKAA